jgi:GT2 family glycosyltransferase
MATIKPIISIVITGNTFGVEIGQMLNALSEQAYNPLRMEVVVATNAASVQLSEEQMRQYPFDVRLIDHVYQNSDEGRNLAAAQAQGDLLLFLNSEVDPQPGLIKAHVEAHGRKPGGVVFGADRPIWSKSLTYLAMWVRLEQGRHTQAMRQAGYRFTYRDVPANNLSLSANLFSRLGGFDPDCPSVGDQSFDLGMRLITAGVPLTFVENALVQRRTLIDAEAWFRLQEQSGRTDVILASRYSALQPHLKLGIYFRPTWRASRILRSLAFNQPRIGHWAAARLLQTLRHYEKRKMRRRWSWLFDSLTDYWYWRGVKAALNSEQKLASFIAENSAWLEPAGLEIELDLMNGLDMAEQRLNDEHPASVRLTHGQYPVGHITFQPGAEPLRGEHLRPLLATNLAMPFLQALTLNEALYKNKLADQPLPIFNGREQGVAYVDQST